MIRKRWNGKSSAIAGEINKVDTPNADPNLPSIIALHGCGGRAENSPKLWRRAYEFVQSSGLIAYLSTSYRGTRFRAIVVAITKIVIYTNGTADFEGFKRRKVLTAHISSEGRG